MKNLRRTTAISALAGAVIYLALFFFVDRIAASWIHNNCSGTWLYSAGKCISYLGKGSYTSLGLALCFILILVYDSGLKKRETKILLYVCLCAAVAMIIGDGLKFLLGRYRPVMLFEKDMYGFHFFSTKWVMNSTPSGHTLRAFSIMTALALIYRRFAPVFISFAVVMGLSRVAVTDHYPSDVLFGAFIGIFAACWVHAHFFRDETHVRE